MELVDQYLGNRLTGPEKSAFERKLETDTELRNEFSFQQKVVDSIRQARVAELKNMLNDIPVSSIPTEGASLLPKIGLWVVATAVIGTGLYFYLNQQDSTVVQPVKVEAINDETPANPKKDDEPKEEIVIQPKPDESSKLNNKVKTPAATADVKKPQDEPVKPAVLDVYDPTEETAKAGELETEHNKGKDTTAPSILVETLADSKYNFHYQFKDNKLYLYGSFEKNLYEIMEFFSNNKHTMFLFYKENYYLLNEEDEKVKPLAPIKDPTLLEKLKDYRKN